MRTNPLLRTAALLATFVCAPTLMALGGSPAQRDAALLPEVAIVDGHLTMTMHKAPGTLGLEWTVQANKTLAVNGWTTSDTQIMDEDANVLIVRCTKTVEQQPTCMLRLRVRLEP